MAVLGFHVLHTHHPSSASPHIQNPHRLYYYSCRRLISISNNHSLLLVISSPWPLHICRSRQWDSNAESYNTNNFNFNTDEEGDDFDDSLDQGFQVLEDYIDSIWIFKVFRSFGWMFPFIIISLTVATGPKAFLLALAVPLGQSTFAFAFQRMQGEGKNKPNVKSKTKKRRSRVYGSKNVKMEEEAESFGIRGARMRNKGYQSWVSGKDVSVSSNHGRSKNNFGGWDELDAGKYCLGSSRRAASKSSGLQAEKGKNRRWIKNDGPLLLRLLISIFPFLKLWTRLL